ARRGQAAAARHVGDGTGLRPQEPEASATEREPEASATEQEPEASATDEASSLTLPAPGSVRRSRMRVLTAPGHGFSRVRYSRTGRQLLGLGRLSASWLWDLAGGGDGVRLENDQPPLNHSRCWRLPHGDDFLRLGGYWPEGEEWPLPGALRPEHLQ